MSNIRIVCDEGFPKSPCYLLWMIWKWKKIVRMPKYILTHPEPSGQLPPLCRHRSGRCLEFSPTPRRSTDRSCPNIGRRRDLGTIHRWNSVLWSSGNLRPTFSRFSREANGTEGRPYNGSQSKIVNLNLLAFSTWCSLLHKHKPTKVIVHVPFVNSSSRRLWTLSNSWGQPLYWQVHVVGIPIACKTISTGLLTVVCPVAGSIY